ncbi:HNH endonuclease family protein [Rhodococcus sp. NPDC004095]
MLASAACGTTLDAAPSDPQAPSIAVDPAHDAPSDPPTAAPDPGSEYALRLLSALPVKGHAPKSGYDRDLFGQSWTDDVDVEGGHNGCDTRNDILRRDLTDVATRDNTRGCKVTSGTLFDEYTGETKAFTSGPSTSPLVQIDHLVSLSNAWQTGAQQLDEATRTALANDPLNLQAVAGAVNQKKGNGDAATWLPPRGAYRCTYVARQVEVKARYGLWVTQAEREAIARTLSNCGTA